MLFSAMDLIFMTLGFYGSFTLWRRLTPMTTSTKSPPAAWPLVSIIIPARNEEDNIGPLLKSLKDLDYSRYEVILVDDNSTDQTAAIAKQAWGQTDDNADRHFHVITGAARPEGWAGKQWACQQGASKAKGDLLLFTDADTIHPINSLKKAVSYFLDQKLDVMSALPYHRCLQLWDKIVGPFQLMLLGGTAPFAKPQEKRLFAIGQYLLFSTSAYQKLGQHERVKMILAEDLALAKASVRDGLAYQIFPGFGLFKVAMYGSLQEFIEGWRRNFRLGMEAFPVAPLLDVVSFYAAFLGGGQWFKEGIQGWIAIGLTLITLRVCFIRQGALGAYQPMGVFLFPFSLLLHSIVSMLAVWDKLRNKDFQWKGRSYETASLKSS